jgi:uncharacterized protein YbjT (DUF2867 family)
MYYLIVGGTGTVGRNVVTGLLARNESIRVLTTSPEKAVSLPRGVEAVVADLNRSVTLAKAFDAIEGVFLVNALAENETAQGLAAVTAARAAGVKRIVYMSVAQADRATAIPHFASKLPVEEAVKSSGISWTILRPNNFFQNDLWLRDVLLGYGVYPQPIGDRGIDRIDVRDIADAAVNALTSERASGTIVEMNGPATLTGSETARIYGGHLGKEIHYSGNDVEIWGNHQANVLPAWLIKDLKIMYTYFQEKGLKGTPQELAAMESLLGHPARTFEGFAAETCHSWKSK